MKQTYFTTILCVFLASVFMKVKSQTERSIGSTMSESERCVCQPHVTINPPVCGRSVPVNSGTVCNSTTVQEILRSVSGNQETVSSELADTRRKVDELQVAVSSNQETVTTELRNTTQQLKHTRREMEELQVTVSGNQEMVTSEVRGIRRQLEELQVSVSALVELLNDTSLTVKACASDTTESSELATTATTEAVTLPKDCSEILARGVSMSGVYTAQPLDSGEAFQVYCDMETDGGGWMVFQRRQDGSVDFYLDFASYRWGFGDLEGEFWLGNDNLHRLTAQGEYELRVDISDFEDSTTYAVYDSFSIADESDNYRLAVGAYSGTAGDSMSRHNNHQFTTKDRDNDPHSTANCAQHYHGAWWYDTCYDSNLNVTLQKDCSEILARGVSMSGVYTVQPLDSGEAFHVYCDMETDGGGWTESSLFGYVQGSTSM